MYNVFKNRTVLPRIGELAILETTRAGIVETIGNKFERGVTPWYRFWCICVVVAK
jgi:hypothetical protein